MGGCNKATRGAMLISAFAWSVIVIATGCGVMSGLALFRYGAIGSFERGAFWLIAPIASLLLVRAGIGLLKRQAWARRSWIFVSSVWIAIIPVYGFGFTDSVVERVWMMVLYGFVPLLGLWMLTRPTNRASFR